MSDGRATAGPARQRLRRIVSIEKRVSDHYTHGSLAAAILGGLEEAAGHAGDITSADLAPVDEFHIGGRAASVHLIDQLGFESGMRILDVGSGLGGTARYVAENCGCRVTGIDLTAEYCDVARMLAEKVALADKVSYREGSALEMPFAEETFDGVYTIHVAMNIADKPKLYREVHRVIRPGATFGIIRYSRRAGRQQPGVPGTVGGHSGDQLPDFDRPAGCDARGSGF